MSAQCRTCGDQILWAVTINQKRVPLNAAPVATGLFVVDATKNPPLALYARPTDAPGERFSSHFATCPDADLYRKKHLQRKP